MGSEKGLFVKYRITKASGDPLPDSFEGFVLRLDEDADPHHRQACIAAVLAYADQIETHMPALAADIRTR